ncbi:hypothetical protein PLESTB_000528300 [Pleodorina starrii]|uniref:Uncharacterized protein n=1 Tax=Pleodorina starrii TaxID=330485 RepID=A0A9W6BGM9_9CHLO|nr:hypothetical protein PLESTM_000391700 [Pleodorina starrii]GLC51678.1 hypothetical protein PLESTB_000528300 [Pleodorina starrii]
MPVQPVDLSALLGCVHRALIGPASAGREAAALVERTCVTGSLGRCTYAVGCEATGLVLFLNIDLQFSPDETLQALNALAAALRSGLACDGWSFELHIEDAECRGGLWATLHCRPRKSEDASAAGHDVALQLFLAENMTSSVRPRQAGAREETAGAGDAAAAESGDGPGKGLLDMGPVVEHKARQQQENLVAAAAQRARRDARHQARHGGAVTAAAPAAAWVAKLGCGMAEARCVFWSRQPEAALRAARAAHGAWNLVVEKDLGQDQRGQSAAAGPGGRGDDKEAGDGSGGAGLVLWSDEILHLVDMLALHAYREAHAQAQPAPAEEGPTGQSSASSQEGAVVSRLFGILSTDYANSTTGLRVEMEGGLLASRGGSAEAPAGAVNAGREVGGDGERRLVVLDPCFPLQDLYAAACEAVGQGEGAEAGQRRLQRLAAAAAAAVARG